MSQTIAGALVGGALGAYGKKPTIPTWEAIDPSESQAKSIAGNIKNFDQATALASETNQFNQGELEKLLERALPGGSTQIKKNLLAELHGELPPDVLQQVLTYSASKSSGGGFGDSGMKDNLSARDLGLTSYGIIQNGLSSSLKWLAQSMAPQMDVSRMFFTPQQILSFDVDQQGKKFQRDLLANQVEAAPDPNMVQLAQGFDNFFKTWSSVGTGMLGGGVGGMMGGMGGGGGGSSTGGFGNSTSSVGGLA